MLQLKGNRLFNVLKSLNIHEFHQFGKFVRSPYFNQSEDLVRFYDYIADFYPAFESDELTKDAIYEVFYPNQQYNDKKLRDRFAHMLKLLRQYLADIKFDDSNLEFKKNVIIEYHNRGLNSLIPQELAEMTNTIENLKIKDEDYYLEKYMLEVVKRRYYSGVLIPAKAPEMLGNITNEIDHIIHFFLIVMLKEYSRLFNYERTVKSDHKMKFFEEIMGYLSREKGSYEDILLVKLLYNFLQLYRTETDEKAVYKLKDLLDNNRESLEEEVFKIFYIELYNYCKRKQSSGLKNFGHLSFVLIEDMLQKEVFYERDGTMAAHTYINLAASGLRDGKLEWAEKFINQYKNKINMENMENAYNYNYAVLYYMKGYGKDSLVKNQNYNLALACLAKVKSEDFYYATRIKNHALKIYYELDYTESAFSLIDTYHHYLSRNQLIPAHLSERYNNFISFLNRLLMIKSKGKNIDYSALNSLSKEINDNSKTEYKGWLLDMIKQL